MPPGHSRNKSDDSEKLLFGLENSDENPLLEEQVSTDGLPRLLEDPSFEPSLAFRQPNVKFASAFRHSYGRFSSFVAHTVRTIRGKVPSWFNPVKLFTILFTNTKISVPFLLVAILMPIALGAVAVYRNHKESGEYFQIDKSLASFEIPNHPSSLNRDALSVADKESKHCSSYQDCLGYGRKRRSTDEKKTVRRYQNHARWTLDLVYVATGGNENIFEIDRLETIHKVEQKVMEQKDFQKYCWKSSLAGKDIILELKHDGCTPPISLIDFFFPSVLPNQRIDDGQGSLPLTEESVNNTLSYLLSQSFTYWFVDDKFSAAHPKSKFLRAQVNFGSPLRRPDGKHGQIPSEGDRFEKFVETYVETLKPLSTDKVKVLYGGTQLYDFEVETTLSSDLKLALLTLVLIVILVFILTSFSLFLTFFGVLAILLSLPLAYFHFRVVFAVKSVGILSGVSLFIIIGIGVDDVFVFINTFRQATHAPNLEARMSHTLLSAGKATFFTSFTTAAAFAANCFSQMPAIHDFGLFMALIVGSCWWTVFLVIPPVLNLWYRFIATKCERSCTRPPAQTRLPGDIVMFLAGNSNTGTTRGSPREPDSSTQYQLVTVDPSGQFLPELSDTEADLFDYPDQDNSDFDTQLLVLDSSEGETDPQPQREDSANKAGCNFVGLIQLGLYKFIAVPIQKFWYIAVFLYIVLLCTTVGIDTMIKVSSQPPAFFRTDTNLQQLLELRSNMSDGNYDISNCEVCAAIIDNVIHTNSLGNPTSLPPRKPTVSTTVATTITTPTPPKDGGQGGKPNRPHIEQPKTQSTTVSHPTKGTEAPHRGTGKPTQTPARGHTTKGTPTHEPNRKTKPTAQTTQEGTTDLTKSVQPTAVPNRCDDTNECTPIEKPIVDSTAVVYVVFGISKIDRSQITRSHVIEKNKGAVIYDESFTKLYFHQKNKFVMEMCRICTKLAANSALVRPGGADCFPDWLHQLSQTQLFYQRCKEVKRPVLSSGDSKAKVMRHKFDRPNAYGNTSVWVIMAFESTTSKGKSAKQKLADYHKWNAFLEEILKDADSSLKSGYQTSDLWQQVLIEITAINSAIYGIVFSLFVCVTAVIIFTGHIMLALIIMLTILGVLCTVISIFYATNWQLGAVEAISLSILVGTSVDYCVHLVEGYILAGNALPRNLHTNMEKRGWRMRAAVSHIGSSILSSSVTTIVASLPLCFTTIQLFAKFGQIMAINTAVSMFFTFTICVALLRTIAPAKFRSSLRASCIATVAMGVFIGMGCLLLYIISLKGVEIPGPGGEPLFDVNS